MATNVRTILGSAGDVFAVLADGSTYADWVVGTKEIRAVDSTWPSVGSKLHHTVGVGPLTLQDDSKVLAVDPDRRLELEARAWPAGTARIELRLEPTGEVTRVSIEEHPLRGPGGRLHNPLFDLIVWVRNIETLRRLDRVVQRHRRSQRR